MKKSSMFFTIFYVIIVFVLHLQARDEYLPQFSVSYALQQDKHNNSMQFPSVEQSRAVYTHSKKYAYGSFEYKQALLNRSGLVTIAQKKYPVTEEDYDVIQKICLDNPDKNKDELWKALLQSSVINEAAILMKDNQQLDCFESDIYINPEHCKQLANAQQRLPLLKESADNAIKDRYKREKYHLDVNYKAALKKAKKKSKTEENKVVSAHKKALADLNARYNQEKKYPLGIQQPKKSVVGSLQSQSQVIQQTSHQQVSKKSNISLQEVQRLREHNNQVLKANSAQDSVFQQIMDKRSQAFDASIKNQTPTTEYITINSQTRAFLQAQGVDTAPFQQIEGLPIQHQLTNELVDILDAVADYAQQHHYEIYQTHLSKYCVHLASLSQQSNIEGALQQAIDGTNCCHGITHYLKGMISEVTQAYQQFQTALDYLQPTLEEYTLMIAEHALHGAATASVLEAMVTAGMIIAPTATVAATGIMIGATAYVMAPLCLQALLDLKGFGGACILGNWDKVTSDLDNFGKFMSSKATVARMAEFAGGATVSTPNLNYVVNQVSSLRPVLTRVQNEAGQTISKLYVMSKHRVQKVYQQSVELLQSRDFLNFNLMYEKILGCHFFDILPKSHPVLAVAFSGLESRVMNSAEQTMMTQLFTQADSAVAGEVIKNEVIHAVYPIVENINQSVSFVQNIVQQEIQQALQQSNKMIGVDLFAPINLSRATELADLSKNIRQLQDLSKYTNKFQNLNDLIPEDTAYLNRIYELQPYRAQIKNFLDTHKPYFMYDGQQYFIEDIASYHIHAGDYARKEKPKGGHSNYEGNKLDCFKPEIIKNGPLGAQDVLFYNSRNSHLTKASSIYPESWSEFVCDLKAIEVMMSANVYISEDAPGVLTFRGKTLEGLDLVVHYHIEGKMIRSHYPDSEKF